MNKWLVTYSIITAESAEHGDTAEGGIVADSLSLRDAVAYWRPRTSACDGGNVESDSWPVIAPRWFTKTFEEFETGDIYQVTLHIPEWVTPASRRRLACMLGVQS